jgi:hypothetical protein
MMVELGKRRMKREISIGLRQIGLFGCFDDYGLSMQKSRSFEALLVSQAYSTNAM